MKTSELEQVIRDYILEIYKKKYIGKIEIQALDPVGYLVHLHRLVSNCPITIMATLEDEAFLKFLKEDLRTRLFHLVSYGELNLVYPDNCQPNSVCK